MGVVLGKLKTSFHAFASREQVHVPIANHHRAFTCMSMYSKNDITTTMHSSGTSNLLQPNWVGVCNISW